MNSVTNEESKYQALDRSEKWTQLTNALNLRSSQDQVIWSIFGAFWGANAILLVALFTTGKLPEETVGGVVSGVGLSLSVIWHIVQNRALGHLARFEALMSTLEKSLKINPDEAVSSDINVSDYQKHLGKRRGVGRKLMKGCSLGGAILWFLGLAYFVGKGGENMEQFGIGCIGFVFGYLLYYSVRHTEKFDVTLLSAAIGAVGSEAVIAWLSPQGSQWIGPYGIGLFAGFIFYLGLTLYFIRTGKFDDLSRRQIFFVSLLGVKPPNSSENQQKISK